MSLLFNIFPTNCFTIINHLKGHMSLLILPYYQLIFSQHCKTYKNNFPISLDYLDPLTKFFIFIHVNILSNPNLLIKFFYFFKLLNFPFSPRDLSKTPLKFWTVHHPKFSVSIFSFLIRYSILHHYWIEARL